MKYKYLISWANGTIVDALLGHGTEIGKLEIEFEQSMTSDLLKQAEAELRKQLRRPELIITAFSKFE